MALVKYCCCCCDESKRKVEDDADVSDPLLTDKEKSDAKFEEKGKEDKRGNKPAPMKKNMTVGDIEIDSSDDDISDMTGVPPPEMISSRRGSNETAGSITIPHALLDEQVSIRNLAKDVSLSMTGEAAISAGLKSSMKTSKVGGSKEEMGKVQASKRVSIQEDDEEDEEVFEL